MSMKHTGRYHQAADKKRRVLKATRKDESRERRAWFDAVREAEKTGKTPPPAPQRHL